MQLVPGSLRRPAMALLAACVAVIAATGVRFPGYGLPGWLDATFDPRFQAQQGRFPVLLDWLPHLGELKPVTAMTFALMLACAITRRWRGAVLTALAVPLAIGIRAQGDRRPFPAGTPPAVRAGGQLRRAARQARLRRLVPVLGAAVAAAMVAIGAHTFSDAVGGAAVGVGVVLACALTLDALGSLLRPEPAVPPPPAARPAAERPAGCQVRPQPPTRL